jgi:transposase
MLFLQGDIPVNGVAKLIGENPMKVWDVFNYWVEKSYAEEDHSDLTTLVMDETSTKKGHNYITVATDAEQKRVVRCEEGKDMEAVGKIQEYLTSKGSPKEQIKHVCMDMSKAYIAGCMKEFPDAQITFDRFHVMQIVNKAMDKVRKLERRESELLKGHKYTVLKNASNLSVKRKGELDELLNLFPKLGEAYRLKELVRQFWLFDDESQAKFFLYEWLKECYQSGMEPFKKAANTITSHWTGVTNFTLSRLTSGVAESINRKIQTVKRLARGFRNRQNFMNMIYYKCGKLSLQFPHF